MWVGPGADVGRFWDAHAPANQTGVSQTRHGRAQWARECHASVQLPYTRIASHPTATSMNIVPI